jgi:hypothetical protein
MFWFLFYSRTSALRIDELVTMQEIRLFHEGQYGIGFLWTPYWGQRILIQRLLVVADQRFFHLSNTPLVVVNMLAQCGTASLVMWLEWRLLRDAPRWVAVLALAATAHLALSSLQLENFAYGGAVYGIGWLAAVSAISVCAFTSQNGTAQWPRVLACLGCILVCTLSFGGGVMIGAVVFLVALGLRAKRSLLIALAVLSAALPTAYFIGYTNPGGGVGVPGALRHPIDTIQLVALVLGGPITNQSRTWGPICGTIGAALFAGPVARLIGRRASREQAAITGFCLFVFLSAVSIALGRFTPESVAALGPRTMLPSRYLTVSFLFWGPLTASALSGWRAGGLSRVPGCCAAAIVAYMTLHTVPSQLECSMAWLEFHRTLDVAGAGMIMDVTDPKFLFLLFPDQRILDYHRAYMRKNRLSVFADARASWIARDVPSVFGAPVTGCRGRIDAEFPAGPGKVRLEGFVSGTSVRFPRESQIVLADAAGKIDGLGNTLAIQSRGEGLDFVAYADAASGAAYVITAQGSACKFSP